MVKHTQMRKLQHSDKFMRCIGISLLGLAAASKAEVTEVASIDQLANVSAGNSRHIRLKPGVYMMADYLTDARFSEIAKALDPADPRAVLPFFSFTGSGNRIDCEGAEVVVNTALYAKAPKSGYHCTFVVSGSNNTITVSRSRQTEPARLL